MLVCQPVGTPVEEGLELCIKIDQVLVDKERYMRVDGRWMIWHIQDHILSMF